MTASAASIAAKPRARRATAVRPRKLRLVKPDETARAALKSDAAAALPPSRPLLDSASTFVRNLEVQHREAVGEMNLIDASEGRDEEAHQAAIARLESDKTEKLDRIEDAHRVALDTLVTKRDAERDGRSKQRAEYAEIAVRCEAALAVPANGEAKAEGQ